MKKVMLALTMIAGLQAQEVARIIQLKHTSADRMAEMLGVLTGPGVNLRVDRELQRIVVSASAERVAMIEDFARKLDVPPPAPKNIEITVYMLAAQQQPAESGPIPDELSGVVKQLRGVFGLQGFRVLETMVMRGREGKGGEASGHMNPPRAAESQPSLYTFRYQRASISGEEKARTVRLDGVRFNGRIPITLQTADANQPKQWQYLETGVNTDVDVREGQKVVIGKASIGAANTTLFLVVSAKVID